MTAPTAGIGESSLPSTPAQKQSESLLHVNENFDKKLISRSYFHISFDQLSEKCQYFWSKYEQQSNVQKCNYHII
mgnify:CR=1 FL=1